MCLFSGTNMWGILDTGSKPLLKKRLKYSIFTFAFKLFFFFVTVITGVRSAISKAGGMIYSFTLIYYPSSMFQELGWEAPGDMK